MNDTNPQAFAPGQTAEDKNVGVPNEAQIREEIVTATGLDPESNAEAIDVLVQREVRHKGQLSKAIDQKASWREKAQAQTEPQAQPNSTKTQDVDIDALVDQKLKQHLEDRDLRELSLPEELEAEVKKVAKMNGISVKDAAKDEYFQFRKNQYEKAERIRKATPQGGATPHAAVIDPSKPLNMSDFDFSTPEGREQWEKAKTARQK